MRPGRSMVVGRRRVPARVPTGEDAPMQRWDSGQGEHREARGSHMWFKATAAATAGRFSLMERTLPPGGRMPPAHRHTGNDEAYFVLQGTVAFHVEDETFTGEAGTFVLVGAGEAHTF